MTIPDAATNARELLEGITPGPWFAEHDPKRHPEDPERWVDSHANVFGGPVRVVDVAQGSNDAEFIASAPALVRSLLAALETAETERDRTIRSLLDMCVMADVIDEGYAAEVRAALGGVS